MAKVFAAIFASFIALYAYFLPRLPIKEGENALIYSNPLGVKALSFVFAPLIADFVWLHSVKIRETKREQNSSETQNIRAAFALVAALDPNFFSAINYGATYLAFVKNDKKAALFVVDSAKGANAKNAQNLAVLSLLIELTSENPNIKEIEKNAQKLYENGEGEKLFGMDKKSFLQSAATLATGKNGATALRRQELERLLAKTKDEKRRGEIKRLLDHGSN